VIDSREELENVCDLAHFNSESVSNEIDERDLQIERQSEQGIWTSRGIVIDLREKQ
jgi:hypothetical protein